MQANNIRFYTRYLENKKVLVISPFTDTIKKQYEKRMLLFDDVTILPQFSELITLKAVQSIHDAVDDLPFATWFEALNYMKDEIKKVDFDVAIIGCGAYGIFLADFCKSLGKKAIHLGGATQLLFGIIGRRWETEYNITINEHWTRPDKNEKPKGYEKVEGGCYW